MERTIGDWVCMNRGQETWNGYSVLEISSRGSHTGTHVKQPGNFPQNASKAGSHVHKCPQI
jgi:hypothetical protein